ncbi:MAG TPA: DUF2637 domain-containing protein [Streptosporangiaceae bacterium]
MTGGRAIRWSTVAAVAAVAVVAGWVSYVHAYDVVAAHGEHGTLARLYPGTIDGLIYAASMVLLDAARRGARPPALARWLLTAGIGATLFANVLAGAAYGVLGAAVAAWPALALVGSYELLMYLVRHGVPAVPVPHSALNGHAARAAELFAADVEAGRVPGIRAIRSGLRVGQDKASQVQAYLRDLTEGK